MSKTLTNSYVAGMVALHAPACGLLKISDLRKVVSATRQELDQAILNARAAGYIRIVPIGDLLRAGRDAIEGGIPGIGETLGYVEVI